MLQAVRVPRPQAEVWAILLLALIGVGGVIVLVWLMIFKPF